MSKYTLLLIALLLAFSIPEALADQNVSGYYRSNGTYVQPYVRSSPDNTVTNNYSYQGNTNPYTGQTGTNPYTHDLTSPNYTGPNSQGQVGHSGYNNGYGGSQ